MKPMGLLTLQGDYEKHRRSFHALGVDTRNVRRPEELDGISGLVIPGGESTTLTRLVDRVAEAASRARGIQVMQWHAPWWSRQASRCR